MAVLVLSLLFFLPAAGQAQEPSSEARTAGDAEKTAVDPLSPRAALASFLDACRQGRLQEAARFLARPPDKTLDGSRLAGWLKAVLDRHIWFTMEEISPLREGDLDDGQPQNIERLGMIPTSRGKEPVEMVHRPGGDPPGWVFSPSTVQRIPAWHADLGGNWLRDRIPAPLRRPGPLELQWWQWLALPVIVFLAYLLSRMAGLVIKPLATRLVSRTPGELDDLLLKQLTAPALFFLALAMVRSSIGWLDLTIPAQAFIGETLRTAFLVGLFWGLTRLVDVAFLGLGRSSWLQNRQEVRGLLPLAARTGRLVILCLGVVTILQEFDFTVTGLLAGMGLAGMAVALAGQKSIENLLGSATILMDRPFRVGDFVRVDDLVGTIEQVGLRSTRLRTLDRTLVTIPNGRLSDMRLETFAARDSIRLYSVLGLTYSTTAEQLAKVIQGLETVLREHPRVSKEPSRVRFVEFGDFALKLEVFAYLKTTDWGEFLTLRQELYFRFMEVVEKNGSSFAFPTQTVHLEMPGMPRRRAPWQAPSPGLKV
ncbi:MAG: mechanosensitive ion channel family protein [Acidobacteriota bacterium]